MAQVALSSLACMQCFKSKCKCVSRPNGDGCERCYRLKKQCRPSDSVRKGANAQRRHNSVARIGVLERKVDSLTKLLSHVAQSPVISGTLDDASCEDASLGGCGQLFSHDEQAAVTGDEGFGTRQSRASSPMNSVSLPPTRDPTIVALANPTLDSDTFSTQDPEACLATFRDKMLPSFSFTYISPDVTSQQLHADRPFLMRAIMAVASPCKQQKVAYGKELKDILAQVVLIQNQSSLDLLQGLLVFTAWSYDQIINPSGTLSRLMLLAISLACDLRLDKQLPSDEHMMKPMVDDEFELEQSRPKNWLIVEEQRAVLACYVLSSIISIYFAQIDAMKWKPRMEESLRAIETNKDCLADVAFAFQVRLHLLAQRAVQFREQREWDFADTNSVPGQVLSANFYIRTLQSQLHQLGNELPSPLQQRGTLRMHQCYIELCVNETARNLYFHTHQGLARGSGCTGRQNLAGTSGGNTFDFDRLDYSWRSVVAVKAWMVTFFSLSPAECAGLSFIHMAQLARCLVVLYRLSTFVHPGWDCSLVHNTLDILSVLDNAANKLELASSEVGEQFPDDQFMHLSAQMRKFRTKAAARMSRNASTVDGRRWLDDGDMIGPSGHEGAGLQDEALWEPFSSSDDVFLDNILRDFGNGWSV